MFLMFPKNFNGWDGLGLFLAGFLVVACWVSIVIPLVAILP